MISNPGPVAIIGAGVAGLSAAYHLAQVGRRVVILEAQERVGGRILTRSGVELGAEFIHGEPKATVELLRGAHIELSPLDGEHWQLANGRLEPMADNSDDLRELVALASRKRGDRSVREFLDEVGADPARRDAASWMERIVEGFDAADPAMASLKSIVSEWTGSVSTEAEQSRPVGGYGGLVDYMLHRLDPTLVRVRRSTPVQHVHWSAKGAELTVSAESSQAIEATAVIVTVPLSLLQSEAIQFDPPLEAKAEALAGLAMGPVHRVMLRYPTAIWESLLGGPVRAGTFLHAPGQRFPTFWTTIRARRGSPPGAAGHGRPGSASRTTPPSSAPPPSRHARSSHLRRVRPPIPLRFSSTTGSVIPGRLAPTPTLRSVASRHERRWPGRSTAFSISPERPRTLPGRHQRWPARSCRERAPRRRSSRIMVRERYSVERIDGLHHVARWVHRRAQC